MWIVYEKAFNNIRRNIDEWLAFLTPVNTNAVDLGNLLDVITILNKLCLLYAEQGSFVQCADVLYVRKTGFWFWESADCETRERDSN